MNHTRRYPTTPAVKPGHNFLHDTFYVLQWVFSIAFVVATLFTAWGSASLLTTDSAATEGSEGGLWATPTAQPRPRIGLVVGHWGNDSGATCEDGLTEVEVNLNIATLVQKALVAEGFEVDLLKEFDPRLNNYRAMLLLSIHNDSCLYINDLATGFKLAAATANAQPEKSRRLTDCIRDRYSTATKLPFHAGSITGDMTSYHTFDEISPETPAAIIEAGFLNKDRQILTKGVDLVAQGITNGLLCYIYNESIEPTPLPGETNVPLTATLAPVPQP